MLWLRLHTKVRHDRQIQQMPAELFRHLLNLWTLAKDYGHEGELPVISDTAFELRLSEEEAESVLVKLTAMRLLVKKSGKYAVKNYAKWQYMDDSKNRVRALRERKRNGECNGISNGESDGQSNENGNASNAHRAEQSRAEQNRSDFPVTKNEPPDLTDAFQRLWLAYPATGRTKKIACENYYCEILGHLGGEALADKIDAIHQPVHPGGKWHRSAKWAAGFIQGLDTYIKQHQWEEDPPGQDAASRSADSWEDPD